MELRTCSTNREEIYNMTGYPIMEPPFLSFPIEEMKKKQVEQHFNWYLYVYLNQLKRKTNINCMKHTISG